MEPVSLADFIDTGLSHVERQAMVLDGELYRLGELFVPVAIPDADAVRAAAVHTGRPGHLVIARHTAAWVWGASPVRPRQDQFLADLATRARVPLHPGIEIMESVITDGDVIRLGGASVTAPLRTVLDLCRFDEVFTPDAARTIRELGAIGGFGPDEVIAALTARPHLARKRVAIERVCEAWAVQPELTR